MVSDIMDMFIDQNAIDIMGNWYPRVYAVMSCVIPFTFILASFAFVGLILWAVYRALR